MTSKLNSASDPKLSTANSINDLLHRMVQYDPDERYIATTELMKEIQQNAPIEASLQATIRAAVLKRLDDPSNNVRELASRAMSQLDQKLDSRQSRTESSSVQSTEIPAAYHMHVYFVQSNTLDRLSAMKLRASLELMTKQKLFEVSLGPVNDVPRGPHPIASYEVHIDASQLSRVVGWMMLNHGSHSVLLHPLTSNEVLDHTTRAMWLGEKLALNLSCLSHDLTASGRSILDSSASLRS